MIRPRVTLRQCHAIGTACHAFDCHKRALLQNWLSDRLSILSTERGLAALYNPAYTNALSLPSQTIRPPAQVPVRKCNAPLNSRIVACYSLMRSQVNPLCVENKRIFVFVLANNTLYKVGFLNFAIPELSLSVIFWYKTMQSEGWIEK